MGLFLPPEERARRRQQKMELRERVMAFPTTTADLKESYTIIGILQADSLILLKEEAVKAGGDALVGVGFSGYDEHCYGTAVSFSREVLDHLEAEVSAEVTSAGVGVGDADAELIGLQSQPQPSEMVDG